MTEAKIAATSKPRGRTGPRTEAGKARASSNALKHGLATPLLLTFDVEQQLCELAKIIANGSKHLFGPALVVAECELDLRRIREAKAAVLRKYADADASPEAQAAIFLTNEMQSIDRYERRALSRRKFAIRALDAASLIRLE